MAKKSDDVKKTVEPTGKKARAAELERQAKELKKAKQKAKAEADKAKEKAKAKAKDDADKAKKKAAKAQKKSDELAAEQKKAAKKLAKKAAVETVATEAVLETEFPSAEWTVVALRAKARQQGLTGYSRLTKAQLIERLSA